MSTPSISRGSLVASAAAILVTIVLLAPEARAAKDVKALPKATIGLGLLSGELVLSIEALAGVKNPWALSIPTVVAAAGGAVGGYFIDAKVKNASVSVALLASGLALFIPSLIITAAKLRFVKEEDLAEDVSVTVTSEDESGGESPDEGGGESEEDAARSTVPTALFAIGGGTFQMGVPPLEVLNLYSDEELLFLARNQGVEYRVSVIDVAF